MKVQIDLSGLNKVLQEFEQVGQAGQSAVMATVYDVATDAHQFALDGIKSGPATGTIYRNRGKGRPDHQASAPGEYPASDTGQLMGNVKFIPPKFGETTAYVGTKIMHGRHLEFGTVNMAARPWLLPSVRRAIVGVEDRLRREFEGKL